MFLLPLYDEIHQLINGIQFNLPNAENPIEVKGIIICGTCDLPAKALFLNMNQYNGKYVCHKCEEEGVRIGNTQVYPYQRNMTMRSENETIEEAAQVIRRPVFSVKGFTILTLLVFQWLRTTTLDPMHCIFEGVMKSMLRLWFDSEFSDMP